MRTETSQSPVKKEQEDMNQYYFKNITNTNDPQNVSPIQRRDKNNRSSQLNDYGYEKSRSRYKNPKINENDENSMNQEVIDISIPNGQYPEQNQNNIIY